MTIEKAEDLARRWMPGVREGGSRRAWEHPQDVVKLLCSSPIKAVQTDDRILMVAWLHDIIEDGIKENGARVTSQDLVDAGLPGEVVCDVVELSKQVDEPKEAYLSRLKHHTPRAKLVKCADRVCNLREGAPVFKTRRWIRYVGETCYFIYPIASDLSSPFGFEAAGWAEDELLKALRVRTV